MQMTTALVAVVVDASTEQRKPKKLLFTFLPYPAGTKQQPYSSDGAAIISIRNLHNEAILFSVLVKITK